MMTSKIGYGVALLLAASLGGCAGNELGEATELPQEGHSFLTIVGDRNVFLAGGAHQTITVKYHSDRGTPLAGSVRFRIDGAGKGSFLSKAEAVTGPGGLATIDVVGGSEGEGAFRVVAEALYATPVDWAVSLGAGNGPPVPYKVEGTYTMDSQFDIVTGLPGKIGEVIRMFVDMTDSPNDPATWLIDTLLKAADSTAVTNGVNAFRPGLDAFLNTLLKNNAPEIVKDFLALATNFSDNARRFGISSELQVYKAPDGSLLGKHTVTGIFLRIGGQRSNYSLAEAGMPAIVVDRVPLRIENNNKLVIDAHALPVSYGKVLVFAMNKIISLVSEGQSRNLHELLSDQIDCVKVGRGIYDYVDFLDAGFYEALCETGIAFAASYVEGKIGEIGGIVTSFEIRGDARLFDGNNDTNVDKLMDGQWEGNLLLGPSERAPLARPNQTFLGTRKP
jgi:hypothetical protein